MSIEVARAPDWPVLARIVAERLGLQFQRLRDLERAFPPIARALGFDSPARCIHWLALQNPLPAEVVQVLARHLAVGETYFYRDPQALEVLESAVLEPLLRERRGVRQQLRIWCAGCCTGEEAYTVAILLHRLLPDIAQWNIAIVATDVHEGFLEKARAGRYGDWSFRDAPPWLRREYFDEVPDRPGARARDDASRECVVRPHIRALVRFSPLNLVDDEPQGAPAPRAVDVVLCRNVLMYFTPEQAVRAVTRLSNALVPGGSLFVGPGEAWCVPRTGLVGEAHPAVLFFRKTAPLSLAAPAVVSPAPGAGVPATAPGAAGLVAARSAYAEPDRASAPASAHVDLSEPAPGALDWARRARSLAGQGRVAEALACCDRWIATGERQAAAHYVRAAVLMEAARPDDARQALERALQADAGFILAHVARGRLEQNAGRFELARRHFRHACGLLQALPERSEVPESEGITAGELLRALTALSGAHA